MVVKNPSPPCGHESLINPIKPAGSGHEQTLICTKNNVSACHCWCLRQDVSCSKTLLRETTPSVIRVAEFEKTADGRLASAIRKWPLGLTMPFGFFFLTDNTHWFDALGAERKHANQAQSRSQHEQFQVRFAFVKPHRTFAAVSAACHDMGHFKIHYRLLCVTASMDVVLSLDSDPPRWKLALPHSRWGVGREGLVMHTQ